MNGYLIVYFSCKIIIVSENRIIVDQPFIRNRLFKLYVLIPE